MKQYPPHTWVLTNTYILRTTSVTTFSPSKNHMSRYCYTYFVRNWGTGSNLPKIMWLVNSDAGTWIQPVSRTCPFIMPPFCLLEFPPACPMLRNRMSLLLKILCMSIEVWLLLAGELLLIKLSWNTFGVYLGISWEQMKMNELGLKGLLRWE